MTRSRDTASIIPTVDAKGDLLVGTADNTIDNLPAGTNGTYLKANSASATGLEWGTGVESIVDAKGDLLVGTADNTVDNLSPGTNGQVLTANSATATGLEWTTPASTGNAIINGAFDFNQRNFTSRTSSGYGHDRWRFTVGGDGTGTYTPQTFTPGAAPFAGNEAVGFARIVTTGQTNSSVTSFLAQRIEDVRTFAGQTVTVSFYAKAGSGTPQISLELIQNFGSGGSAEVLTFVKKDTLSSSWARYTASILIPSITGKTLGAGSYLALFMWVSAGSTFNARTDSLGIQSNTFDIWGVQLEAGTVATPFRRNAPSIQAELAACQRYYEKSTPINMAVNTNNSAFPAVGINIPAIVGQYQSDGWGSSSYQFKVPKRASPGMTFYNTDGTAGNGSITSGATAGLNTGGSALISENHFIRQANLAGVAAGSAYVLRVQWEANAEL
jgi:hypothetical protein